MDPWGVLDMDSNSEGPPGLQKEKIVVAGLENAGKSSILDLVQNRMIKTLNMEPTRGVERREMEIMGNAISIHDFGGQGQYRKLYFSQPRYFEQTDAYIFCVDLQDLDHHVLALEYFEQSLDLFRELGIHPKVYVFFHKFDKEYRVDYHDPRKQTKDQFNSLKSRFTSIARKSLLPIDECYKTSIFDDWSIYAAFYDVWASIVTRLESIPAYLSRLIDDVPGSVLAWLFDASCTVIAKKTYHDLPETGDDLVTFARAAITSLGIFKSRIPNKLLVNTNVVTIDVADQAIFIRKFQCNAATFYLVLAKKPGNEDETHNVLNHIAYSMAVYMAASENRVA